MCSTLDMYKRNVDVQVLIMFLICERYLITMRFAMLLRPKPKEAIDLMLRYDDGLVTVSL